MHEGVTEKQASRRWITPERVLLTAVVALQVAILVHTRQTDTRLARLDRFLSADTQQIAARNESPRHQGDTESTLTVRHSPYPGDSSAHVHQPAAAATPWVLAHPIVSAPNPLWGVPSRIRRSLEMQDSMNRMLAQAMSEFEQMESFINMDEGWNVLSTSPTLDMRDQKDRYLVVFTLPGLDRSEIAVTLEGRLLTVSCYESAQARQIPPGFVFERRVLMPGPVAPEDSAAASMSNSVLKVIVPKGRDAERQARRTRLL